MFKNLNFQTELNTDTWEKQPWIIESITEYFLIYKQSVVLCIPCLHYLMHVMLFRTVRPVHWGTYNEKQLKGNRMWCTISMIVTKHEQHTPDVKGAKCNITEHFFNGCKQGEIWKIKRQSATWRGALKGSWNTCLTNHRMAPLLNDVISQISCCKNFSNPSTLRVIAPIPDFLSLSLFVSASALVATQRSSQESKVPAKMFVYGAPWCP